MRIFIFSYENVNRSHYNFTPSEVWSWISKEQPPLKEKKTGYQLNFKHLIHIFFVEV